MWSAEVDFVMKDGIVYNDAPHASSTIVPAESLRECNGYSLESPPRESSCRKDLYMFRCYARSALFSIVALLLTTLCDGQTTQGNIVGTVHDEKGAVLAGASMTVRNTGTRLERRTVTADNGSFRISSLPAG